MTRAVRAGAVAVICAVLGGGLAGRAGAATACVIDTPTGTITCDAVVVRDANAYNLSNLTGLRANNDADITVPGADAALFEIVDTDKTSAYEWAVRHSGRASWMLGSGGAAAGQVWAARNGRVMIYDTSITAPGPTENGGPLLVWRNPSSTAAGEAGGLYVNLSAAHVATPGANDLVAATIRATNDAMRDVNVWGADVLVQQSTAVVPGANGVYVRAAEFEMQNGCEAGECATDPFAAATNKIRPNGIEIVGMDGSGGRNTAAMMVWANDSGGTKWWTNGVALSRVADVGILFGRIAGDAIEPYGTALLDASSLASSYQPLLRARAGGFVDYAIRNYANQDLALTLDTGQNATRATWLSFADQGVGKWAVLKNNGNSLFVWEGNYGGGNTRLMMDGYETHLHGHLITRNEGAQEGVKPTLSGCGTGAAVTDGSDVAGYITLGTSPGTCIVTFAQAWSGRPACACNNESASQLCRVTAVGTTGFTITGTLASGNVISYLCVRGQA